MTPGAMYRSLGICFTAEKKTGNPQLEDPMTKAVRPVIASNGVTYLQMRLVGSQSMSGKEMEGKKCCLLLMPTAIFIIVCIYLFSLSRL
jgi:hypothetical protein